MMTIARFNWPLYLGAAAVFIASLAGVFLARPSGWEFAWSVSSFGAAYFLFGSLGVSHYVYDRSDLYRWSWLERALGGVRPRTAILAHAGFDEASAALREKLGEVDWRILDHFNETQMTEASIRRARALFPPAPGTSPSRHDAWPVAADSADVVLGLLAIHELRSEAERRAWFTEAKRSLRPGGRVVLVEHVRDVANFLAFGPGFWHFHSPSSWRSCWESAGLRSIDEFRITPFIRVFVLSAS
jgi:SAM-dependent methyltransferase